MVNSHKAICAFLVIWLAHLLKQSRDMMKTGDQDRALEIYANHPFTHTKV
jgi:hypothetical protein